jgi:excisionase family DNA binding protein
VSEESKLLDIEMLAERLSVTQRLVRRLVAERRIPYVKVGRFVRFDSADIAEWISTARVPARSLSQPLSTMHDESRTSRVSGSVSRR